MCIQDKAFGYRNFPLFNAKNAFEGWMPNLKQGDFYFKSSFFSFSELFSGPLDFQHFIKMYI
jgi:hypothetical protein